MTGKKKPRTVLFTAREKPQKGGATHELILIPHRWFFCWSWSPATTKNHTRKRSDLRYYTHSAVSRQASPLIFSFFFGSSSTNPSTSIPISIFILVVIRRFTVPQVFRCGSMRARRADDPASGFPHAQAEKTPGHCSSLFSFKSSRLISVSLSAIAIRRWNSMIPRRASSARNLGMYLGCCFPSLLITT